MHRIALCLAVLYCLSVSPTHGAEPIPEAAGPEDREQIPKLIQQLSDQRIPEDAFPYRETYGGYAMRALVNIGIEAVPALTAAVETTDAESRWLPVQGLKRIGPPARTALPVLIRNLDVDSWSLRSEITDSLAKIDRDGTTVIPSLKKMLRDENPYVRESAATGLGAYPAHAETGVPALIAALKDESPDVRAAAVVSLGKIGKPTKTITQSLLPLLHDRGRYALVGHDVVVQFDLIDLVASVLSKFQDQKQVIVPALLAAYHDEQLPSKTGIIDALVHFDAAAEPIVPDLIQAMSRLSTTKDVGRIHEPIVLAQLGKHASGAIPAARKLLRSGDGLAKLYAAGVLACIDPDSPPTAFEVLAQPLQEPNKNSDVTFDFLDVLGPEAEPLVPDLLTFLR
ncbi:HEAT repeat protein [Symmachiella dynata]|uniref:HEAT repeat protein n=1 Tax=Symmachiella dynata TaxID=2527995 RepID=A0A517ZX40_9PLAN|nr:HEAT repeat domain-containing protein [Symmachiella dynata]QDU47051.1 HEAT repeat protein [Symmachiella dynata]